MNRFRNLLLSTTAIGMLAALSARPAYAQMAVFDSASFGELLQEAAHGTEQITELEQVITVNKNQLTELFTLYSSFSHMTNATQLGPLLLEQSTIHSLPEMAQLEGLLRGQGFTGTLASQAEAMLAKTQIYRPAGTDFAATQMNMAAQATAGQMAAAETLYNSNTQRVDGLQDLMTQLGSSADPKQTADIQARVEIENGYAAAQGNQIKALQVMQKAQEDTQQQQQDQAWRQGAENLVAQSTAAGAGS